MILVCPSCEARYNLVQAIEPPGRRVRCRKCAHVWFAEADAPLVAADPQGAFPQVEAPHHTPNASAPQPYASEPPGEARHWPAHAELNASAHAAPAWPPPAPQPAAYHGAPSHAAAPAWPHAESGLERANEPPQESLSAIYTREQAEPMSRAEQAVHVGPTQADVEHGGHDPHHQGQPAYWPIEPQQQMPGYWPPQAALAADGVGWPEQPDPGDQSPPPRGNTAEAAWAFEPPVGYDQTPDHQATEHALAHDLAHDHDAAQPATWAAPEPMPADHQQDYRSALQPPSSPPVMAPPIAMTAQVWPEPVGSRSQVAPQPLPVAAQSPAPQGAPVFAAPPPRHDSQRPDGQRPDGQRSPVQPGPAGYPPAWAGGPPPSSQAMPHAGHAQPSLPGGPAQFDRPLPSFQVGRQAVPAGPPGGPAAGSFRPADGAGPLPRPGAMALPDPSAIRRRRNWAGMAASLLVILSAVGLITFLFVERNRVASLVPGAAGIYAHLGLPVNPHGLLLRNVKVDWVQEDNQQELEVRGEIHNLLAHERRVPSVVVTVRDRAGADLYHAVAGVGSGLVSRGGFTRFTARIPSPPHGVASVAVHFPAPK